MTKPVVIRRLWYSLRLDDDGVHINRKPPIPWEKVGAMGVDHTLAFTALMVLLTPLRAGYWQFTLMRPVLHVCVVGDEYPRPVRAVTFSRRRMLGRPTDADDIRECLGAWASRVPQIAPVNDLNVWWNNRPEAHPKPPPPPPKEPSTHQRAEKIEHELDDLKHQLRQIELRKKHGLEP